MDVTREFNAMIGSLNQLDASAYNELYQDYDFVDDVSCKPLDKKRAIDGRMLAIDFFRRMTPRYPGIKQMVRRLSEPNGLI